MSNSWGDVPDEHRRVKNEPITPAPREILEDEVPSVTPIIPKCGWCGYEFSHPTWNPGDGKKCPSCGAITYARKP